MVVDILIGASLLVAFIAGIAALFAPCCIGVLLPVYLGSIFKQKRTVFLMTFVFFLGLLAVFLPLGLGVAALGEVFSQYHNLIYLAGGLFLLVLAASILLGKHFSLPYSMRPDVKIQSAGSVFTLGVFSGFATLCCAPVLAGALALSILPGSILWGGLYSVAYVLGMVVPLFIIAYFIDKADYTNKFGIFKRSISYKLFGKSISLTMAELLAGGVFLFMGSFILYLLSTNQLASHSYTQTAVNIFMANLTSQITQIASAIPDAIWVLAFLGLFALIIKLAFKKMNAKGGGGNEKRKKNR